MKFFKLKENVKLTNTEKAILIYLNDSISKIPTMSIEEISTKVNSSKAVVSRLVRKLGYSGFKDLKNSLKDLVNNNNVSDSIINSYINDLIQLDKINNQKDIDSIIKEIKRHKFIVFCGEGDSFIVAEIASNLLYRLGYNSRAISHKLIEKKAIMESKDKILLFAISGSGETENIISFCNAFKRKNKIISLTEKTNNTLSKIANYNLYIPFFDNDNSNSMQTSLVSRMVAVHMIASMVEKK